MAATILAPISSCSCDEPYQYGPCTSCPKPAHAPCFVSSIEALPCDLLGDVFERLDGRERRTLRSLCRKSRALINAVTTKLKLMGSDLSESPLLGSRIAARFPALKELMLCDGAGPDSFIFETAPNAHIISDDLLLSTFEEPIWGVTELSIKRCAFLSPAACRALLWIFPNLTCLAASRWASSASLLDLPQCEKLRALDLGDAEVDVSTVDDGALAVVARCSQLRRLSLQRCVAITDAGIAQLLASLPALEHLDISHTRATGAGLAAQQHAGLTSLRAIGCSGLRDAQLVAAAAALPRLSSMSLASCPGITNTGLAAAMPHSPHLSHLDLGTQYELNAEGLASLAPLPKLMSLTVGNFNMLPPPPAMEAGPDGELLAPAPAPPPAPSTRRVSLPALTSLKFGGAWPNRGLRRALPLGPALTKVTVVGFDAVVDTTAAALARQHSLVEVELAGGYTLTPCGLLALARLPNLQCVTLSGCPLVGAGDAAALLAACPSLTRITLVTTSHGSKEGGVVMTRAHPLVAAAAAAAAAEATAQAALAAAAEVVAAQVAQGSDTAPPSL